MTVAAVLTAPGLVLNLPLLAVVYLSPFVGALSALGLVRRVGHRPTPAFRPRRYLVVSVALMMAMTLAWVSASAVFAPERGVWSLWLSVAEATAYVLLWAVVAWPAVDVVRALRHPRPRDVGPPVPGHQPRVGRGVRLFAGGIGALVAALLVVSW